tara:strand:- start:1111 stop:1329 length:219 start_codon:yes stop_codon:yes gene_type:complete
MASASNRTDRGQGSEAYIEAAKLAARRALRKKKPRLTALERAFYERFKEVKAAEAKNLIQLKPRRRSTKKAA